MRETEKSERQKAIELTAAEGDAEAEFRYRVEAASSWPKSSRV